MPKAFLLTNKRYKIWKKIKETFREQQKKRMIEEGQCLDFTGRFDPVSADDNKIILPVDSSTDYSKYTDVTDEEGNQSYDCQSAFIYHLCFETFNAKHFNVSSSYDSILLFET